MNIESTSRNDKQSEQELSRFVNKVYDRIARMGRKFIIAYPVLVFALEAIRLARGRPLDVTLLVVAVMLPIAHYFARSRYRRGVVERIRRQVGAVDTVTQVFTDENYEFHCGGTLIRTQWQALGAHYLFLGDGFAVMEGRNPTLLIPSLSALGVNAAELKEVLANAGLKDYRTYRNWAWVPLFVVVLLISMVAGLLSALSRRAHAEDACFIPVMCVDAGMARDVAERL